MALGVPDSIGDYKILEEIGHGGMGTLYRARDPKIGRDVAIKLLREGLDDRDMRERFSREARSAGRLKHGNIVTIFELGEHNGMPFIAMEYVQGETLAALLKQRPPVSLARKLQMMDQVCAGLHYAHRMGIVHRDIKPANIMIDDEGTMKILDFGIARMGTAKMTQTGMVIGTLNYMAPEQMKGMPIDARADMFSIGAVFYELLSYRNAFAGDAPSSVMHKILYGQPEQLEVVCPNLPPPLVAIVSRCLAKQPEDRFADLGAVRSALTAVGRRSEGIVEDENNATIQVMPGLHTPQHPQTPASGSPRKDSASMEQMRLRAEQTRARQIQAHIDAGRRALEQGDHDAAFAACEQALVLDPTNAQALELEGRARAALDQQLQERLVAARGEVERGALTSASLLIDQVLSVSAESPEAIAIRQAVEEARARLARDQERQRAFELAFSEAQRDLAAGSLDSADQAIERALTFDATHAEALALKRKIVAAVAAAREAKRHAEEEVRARKAVEDARRLFGTGNHAGAYAMLERLAGAHTFVAAALDALKLEAQEIDRRRAEAERQKAEAERQRLEAEAARQKLEAEAARLKLETESARQKLAAEVERLRREGEAERLKLEAEAARLKREAEAERVRRDEETGRRKQEAEQLKREAEAERLKHEAEAERRKQEAEQLKREAAAERLKHEAEAERLRLANEAARVKREAEAERLRLENARTLSIPREPTPAKSPSPPSGRPQAVAEGARAEHPARPQPIPRQAPGATSARVPTGLMLGGVALVIVVVAAGVQIWRQSGGGVTPAEQPSIPPASTPAVEQGTAPPPPVPAPDAASAEQARQQRLSQARTLLDRGDYDAAISEADQVLALDAGNAEATELRAKAAALKAAALAALKPVEPPPVARGRGQADQNAASSAPSVTRGAVPTPAVPTPASPPVSPPVPAAGSAADGQSARARELSDRYTKARSALDAGSFSSAITLFEGIQRDEPAYRDVAALLTRAREGQTTAARQALEAGTKLENSGDLAGALQQYERGRQLDPAMAGLADSSITRVRTRMKTEGPEAFSRGRQYDALDRVDDAITWYERALRSLPDDDPNKKVARDRLEVLRARR